MSTAHQRHEARTGKRVKGSGGIRGLPGDREEHLWLTECKHTTNKSVSIKADWWGRIKREAAESGKRPNIDLVVGDHQLRIIDEQDFIEYTQLLEEQNGKR